MEIVGALLAFPPVLVGYTSLYKLYHYSSLIQGERLPALLRFMLRNR